MTLLVIDGNGLFYKNFPKTEENPQFRADGLPVGAVGGFLAEVHKILIEVGQPQCATHAIVVFDPSNRSNWRFDVFPSYKGNRKRQPNARPQLRLCRALVEGWGVSTTVAVGYEADDFLAAYARQAEDMGMGCVVASADKDALQLLRPGVSIYDFRNRNFIMDGDPIKLGVEPWQVPCYQGMVGDSSDCYPGIPKIGEVTARKLLAEHRTMEGSIKAAAEGRISEASIARLLIDGAEQGRLSRRLAVLDEHAPTRLTVADAELRRPDPELLIGGMNALGVRAWTANLAETLQVSPDDFPPHPGITELSDEIMEMAAA